MSIFVGITFLACGFICSASLIFMYHVANRPWKFLQYSLFVVVSIYTILTFLLGWLTLSGVLNV